MRQLTPDEARLYTGAVDPVAVAANKAALLKRIDRLRFYVESDCSVMADKAITDLPMLLQRWNASRAGFDGAVGPVDIDLPMVDDGAIW